MTEKYKLGITLNFGILIKDVPSEERVVLVHGQQLQQTNVLQLQRFDFVLGSKKGRCLKF